jgi:uncharacterized Ntn-hydrolase superfamily protein
MPAVVLSLLLSAGGATVRPVHTYSIVARDPATGEMGVAVQSHWFSVGSVVSWAEAGVGAVATQSFVDPSYGPLGLALMKTGRTASEALAALLAGDAGRDVRQVGMVDAKGNVATHTGKMDIPAAGGQAGAGYVVQANLMEKATVWPAMARAYESAKGDLAQRMLAALDAAEAEGGDIRGRQSAALLHGPALGGQGLRSARGGPSGAAPGAAPAGRRAAGLQPHGRGRRLRHGQGLGVRGA